jgi:protein-tyrosine-phosphatase
MAEYLMRNWLGADSEWAVGSAGVSASNGQPASPEAVEVLKELGVDLRPHRSRALTRELVDAASLVVVMTASHRSAVLERFAEAHGKVVLLKSVAASSSGSGDVADPIGASAETYRGVRDEINAVLPDLVLYVHDIAGGQSRRKKGAR